MVQRTKNSGDVIVSLTVGGRAKRYLVRELVMEAFKANPKPGYYTIVIHINSDQADNRLENLRWSNFVMEIAAKKPFRSYFDKQTGKYVARISVDGVYSDVGSFDTAEEARERHREARIEAYKAFDAEDALVL